MAFEKSRDFVGEHKLATAATAAAAAAATAAAVKGYNEYHKRKQAFERELDATYADRYEDNLGIFEEEKLPDDFRRNMARVAVHIYYANDAGEDFITARSLREHFEKVHGEEFTEHELGDLTGRLKHHKIIGRLRGTGDKYRSHGFVALPSMMWGMLYSKVRHPLLEEAMDEMTPELTGNL